MAEAHPCIVPGCPAEGRNKLGVRCRVWHDQPTLHGKGKTGARAPSELDATTSTSAKEAPRHA